MEYKQHNYRGWITGSYTANDILQIKQNILRSDKDSSNDNTDEVKEYIIYYSVSPVRPGSSESKNSII